MPTKTKALISITVPGTHERVQNSSIIKELCHYLDTAGIKYRFPDTVAGWGCLNQDWLEFYADIITTFDWCEIAQFEGMVADFNNYDPPILKTWFYNQLHWGKLLMMVNYVKTNEGGEEEYIPHH